MPALGSSVGERPPGSSLAIGEIVAGKYRIEREIGRGGMGIVFAATHLTLDRLVALKVMKHELLQDERALNRLIFEAKSAAKIESEHVAKVLDVETLTNGVPYIVMEYLDGQDLGQLIDRSGALSVQQSVTFVLQACEALAEVHVANLVHRDLKPGNLFIAKRADGSPSMKVVDFGISKYVGGPGAKVAKTTSPHVLGSPFYMAPEQMRADSVDARSDIWALGAILFEMLTARTPFTGETLPEVYAAVLGEPPPPVNELEPTVPPALDSIVRRCLEKDPVLRFPDVAALARELAPFGDIMAQQSVDRITRVLNREEDSEAAILLGRSSEFPTSQAGTPVNYSDLAGKAEPEENASFGQVASELPEVEGYASAAGRPPYLSQDENAALAATYPPDGSENEDSVRQALEDVDRGPTGRRMGSRVEKTIEIRHRKSRKLLLMGLGLAAVVLGSAALLWSGEIEGAAAPGSLAEQAATSQESQPSRRAAALLPKKPKPGAVSASGGGSANSDVSNRLGAQPSKPSVSNAGQGSAEDSQRSGKLVQPDEQASEAAESTISPAKRRVADPVDSPKVSQRKRQVPSRSRSKKPQRRRDTSAKQSPAAVSRSTGSPTTDPSTASSSTAGAKKADGVGSKPSRPKKDYWDSESFGARR